MQTTCSAPQSQPPVTEFNPTGARFFAAAHASYDDGVGPTRHHLIPPAPGYHEYYVYEWLAPRGYQIAATLHGSPNLGDSRKMAIDLAAIYNAQLSLAPPPRDRR